MDSLKEKENNSIKEWMADGGTCLAVKPIRMYGWFKTDDDCVQFCRYLGPEEFEFVQINRYFELFIGSVLDKDGLESYVLPASEYAKITVKPKLGFLWGASIGEAKQYFYTKWLPTSSFEALNLEYEYHTERSTEKQPAIDIIFAIRRKAIN